MLQSDIIDIVFNSKPQLRMLVEQYGNLSLFDYYTTLTTYKNNNINLDRQRQLLTIIEQKISDLYSSALATSVIKYLAKNYKVSTAEHHGVICHPFFLNNTVCHFLTQPTHLKNYSLVLTCGGISLNNSSFPRGLLFHNQSLVEQRLHFFSGHYKHHPVFSLQSYKKEQFTVMKHELQAIPVSSLVKEKLLTILQTIIFSDHVLKQSCFSDQISVLNQMLWQLIPGQEHNELIHLEQEEVVRQLILQYHLDDHSIIHEILCNSDIRKFFITYFENTIGAFNTANHRGTVLFWGIEKGQRVSLWHQNNFLISEDGKFKVALEPETLHTHLMAKTLMPSMALSFVVLSFFYGLICSGGFSQINYLPTIHEAYKKLLQASNYKEEYNSVANLPVSVFSGEFILSTISNQQVATPAFNLDMILYGELSLSEKLLELSHSTSIREAILAMMPEYYKIITGTPIRTPIDFKFPKPSLYV